jgi:hypothetical protein
VTLSIALGAALLGTAARADTVTVRTVQELRDAIVAANAAGGSRTIALADGVYTLPDTLYVNAPGIALTSVSGDRTKVTIQGDAMSETAAVKNLIRVAASDFQISHVTLQKAGWHLIQVAGESNADRTVVRDVVLRDAWEQLLKVTVDPANPAVTGDDGLVEDSVFEYSAGIGPQYYIGGIDAHGSHGWTVRRNVFRDIASPSNTYAEFGVHFWNGSYDNVVERNVFIDCDRAIGFGLGGRSNRGGVIRNNMIWHAANGDPFADVSIYLDTSPGTSVYNNSIYTEHPYPSAIEYRFAETSGVLIVNNLSNRAIRSRDGATGTLGSNVTNAAASWFVDPARGNLHLSGAQATVVDAGQPVTGLTDDYDGDARPQGSGIDIGADERTASRPNPPTNVRAQ